ncbi:hypothetical protein [Thalassospira sp. TSL5-1]|uniref:hypothetical protein n=1 Tax=Thalassospira sp. TSL5-1 TaxID=1544451 RepID=UPI00093CBD0F|nr:hypothetical protein [Thalassospira sp. TSL5-1]OKH87081.1 hypothetical protein LF95_18995 [Thalassospira sp. TSL5-1]
MKAKYLHANPVQSGHKGTLHILARRVRDFAIAGALLSSLSGCSGMDSTVASATGTDLLTATQWYVALDVVSIINTDKTIADHIISMSTGRDCSTVRSSMGEPYCKTDPIPEPPLYCYRTLAAVNCYATPDPYNTGRRPIDWPPTRGRSL